MKGRFAHGGAVAGCLLAAVIALAPSRALADQTQDQQDQAALALWTADYAKEVNGRTADNGICRMTYRLEWVTAPYLRDGSVVGRHRVWQTSVFYEGEHKGRTVEQTVNSFYVDSPEPGVYASVAELRRKYPQARQAAVAVDPFEAAHAEELRALEDERRNLAALREVFLEEYRAGYGASPEGKRPVVKDESYTGEEVSLSSSIDVPRSLDEEKRRQRHNGLLRRMGEIDDRLAVLAALQKAARDSKAELQRLAAGDPGELAREIEAFGKKSVFFAVEYDKTDDKLRAANREMAQALLEAGHNAAAGGLANGKAAMSNPEAVSAIDKLRRAGDKYDYAAEERESYLKFSKEYAFKADFYRLAQRIAGRAGRR